jgi:hypothetical protein
MNRLLGLTLLLISAAVVRAAVPLNARPPVQSIGGNARHVWANDLQVARSSPTAVASGAFATIGGGTNNVASGVNSVVPGGWQNVAIGDNSYAMGGSGNQIQGAWSGGGGFDNWVIGDYSFVAGGTDNRAEGFTSTIIGGTGSIVSNAAAGSGIFASEASKCLADYNLILGGQDNITSNTFAVAIGDRNRIFGHYATGIGHQLTNTTAYEVILGHGVTPVTISSNGTLNIRSGALQIGLNGALLTNTLSATASLDFPSTTAQTSTNLTIALAGAAAGDTVELGIPTASVTVHSCYTAWASNGFVYVSFNNYSAAARDPASGTFRVVVRKWQ